MKLRALLFICSSFFLSSIFYAQLTPAGALGKIYGKVIDSITGQYIDYATVGLLQQEDNKLVNGGTTDEKGFFQLTNVPAGKYKITVHFIGYKPIEIVNIVVSKLQQNVNIGTIKLSTGSKLLRALTVTADKSVIENTIDKMIYSVDKDLSSQGGVATDVLKKIPQVSVDVDGNVELQGNSAIKFLINGKPSTLFGNNVVDVLASIPSSQIQQIEIITSPGAKYDADGTGGIINIVLKKNNSEGFNGNASLTGGTRLENGALNLGMHKGNFSAHAFFSGNAQLKSNVNTSMSQSSFDQSTLQNTLLNQNGNSNFTRNGYQTGTGLDYDMSSKDNVSSTLNYANFSSSTVGLLSSQTIGQVVSGTALLASNEMLNTVNRFESQTLDWSLNYKHKFTKKDRELNFLYTSSSGTNLTYYQQLQRAVPSDSLFSGSYGNNPGTIKESALSMDYTHRLSETLLFETGAKMVVTSITSNSEVYLLNLPNGDYSFNAPQSSVFDYNRNVYSTYISSTFKLFNQLDAKAGIRNEYTEGNESLGNSSWGFTPYNNIVPSAILSRQLKDNQIIKIGYSHRIQRPDFRDLNPFINASDPKNVSTGNINLRPEIADKLELTYSKVYTKGATLNLVLFYRGQRDDIQPFVTYYQSYRIGDSTYSNLAVTTRQNVGREDNFGLTIFASVAITAKLNFRTNVSGYQRYITVGSLQGQNINGFNYRVTGNASYEVSKTMMLEAFGNFNSPRLNIQGTMPSFTTYNFALRKLLFNKDGSIALTATNVFNKYVDQKTTLSGTNFTLMNDRQLPYRSIGINFTYKFGKLKFKKEKELEDQNLVNPPMEN